MVRASAHRDLAVTLTPASCSYSHQHHRANSIPNYGYKNLARPGIDSALSLDFFPEAVTDTSSYCLHLIPLQNIMDDGILAILSLAIVETVCFGRFPSRSQHCVCNILITTARRSLYLPHNSVCNGPFVSSSYKLFHYYVVLLLRYQTTWLPISSQNVDGALLCCHVRNSDGTLGSDNSSNLARCYYSSKCYQ